MDFLESSSDEIRDLLYADAMYKGIGSERIKESLGVDHYPYHTFLLERLWSVYYEVKRQKEGLPYRISRYLSERNGARKVDSKGRIHRFNL